MAACDVEVTARSIQHECRPHYVMACGYAEIEIPKTARKFPAWLLRLPAVVGDGGSHHWWRSKRDFLILFRAAVKANLSPPKSALEKLGKRAPWRRPSYRDDFAGEKDDNYHVSMRKSLMQLDQLIHAIYTRCQKQVEESPGGKESLITTHLMEAWKLFCQPSDTADLVQPALDNNGTKEKPFATTKIAKSSRLGQYFCSESIAQKFGPFQLVGLAFTWIRKQHQNKTTKHRDFIFLEPSCGHGQIINTLLEHLGTNAEYQNDDCRCRVIACDIDEDAISYCQQQRAAAKAAGGPHAEAAEEVVWMEGDFLRSIPDKMFHAGSNTSSCAASSEHTTLGTPAIVICLGGPPYTSGAGSSDQIERDLPQLFLDHSVRVWKSDFVGFILPDRYSKGESLNLPDGWVCETHPLESSTFYFRGTARVTQPSIIQCFFQRAEPKFDKL